MSSGNVCKCCVKGVLNGHVVSDRFSVNFHAYQEDADTILRRHRESSLGETRNCISNTKNEYETAVI